MKNKVIVFMLMLALVIGGSLFASPQQQAPAGTTTLKWAMWDLHLGPYYEPLVKAYEAKNPNVKIELVDLGSADYTTLILTQLAGGADLDIISIKDIPQYVNLVNQNRLEPISSFIRAQGINTAQYSGMVENITINNEVYGLPFRNDFWVVFYNKDIFDRAGVPYPTNDMTLDQYDALARRVTSGSGVNKIYGAHYHTWRSTVQLFGILDGRNNINSGTYDYLAPYYERVLAQQRDGIVMSLAELRTGGIHYSGVFFNGQVAMVNMGTWFVATMIDNVARGQTNFTNWGIVKYPHPNGVPAGTTLGQVTSMGINRNSRNKELAFDFLKFITGPEGALILAQTGTIPAIMDQAVIGAIAAMPGFPTDANSRDALSTVKTYLEQPIHERSGEINTALDELHIDIMTGNISVQQGLQRMNERVRAILAR